MAPKRLTSLRLDPETDRQLAQLAAYEGKSITSVIAAAVEARQRDIHRQIHFDLANGAPGSCPWCGYAPAERD